MFKRFCSGIWLLIRSLCLTSTLLAILEDPLPSIKSFMFNPSPCVLCTCMPCALCGWSENDICGINGMEKCTIECSVFLQFHSTLTLSRINEAVLFRLSLQKIQTTFHCAEVNILINSNQAHYWVVVSDPFHFHVYLNHRKSLWRYFVGQMYYLFCVITVYTKNKMYTDAYLCWFCAKHLCTNSETPKPVHSSLYRTGAPVQSISKL